MSKERILSTVLFARHNHHTDLVIAAIEAGLSGGQFEELSEMVEEVIRANQEAAGREPANAEAVRETMELITQNMRRITDNSKRAETIIRSMLEHSRTDDANYSEADIDQLLEECANIVQGNLFLQQPRGELEIVRALELGGNRVRVDPQALSRVFLNILNNACYAATHRQDADTPDTNTAGTAHLPHEPEVQITSRWLSADELEIRIRDNGSGIKAEHREKIFLPFFTTKPQGSGVGLGLSISYDIVVQQHGGQMEVESEPGEFTEFILRLPASANHAEAPATAATSENTLHAKNN